MKQSAFILNTAMIYILLITMIAFSCVQLVTLELKISNTMVSQRKEFWNAQNDLKQLQKMIIDGQIIPQKNLYSSNDLDNEDGWYEHAQSLIMDGHEVQYLVETNDCDPCLQIQNELKPGVEIFNIRIHTTNINYPVTLQENYAMVCDVKILCKKSSDVRMISAGLQGWWQLE